MEQTGLSLVQNKKEEVSSAVMNTLQEINHSWANLDHMVKESLSRKLQLQEQGMEEREN